MAESEGGANGGRRREGSDSSEAIGPIRMNGVESQDVVGGEGREKEGAGECGSDFRLCES